jgi:hypothetical protein
MKLTSMKIYITKLASYSTVRQKYGQYGEKLFPLHWDPLHSTYVTHDSPFFTPPFCSSLVPLYNDRVSCIPSGLLVLGFHDVFISKEWALYSGKYGIICSVCMLFYSITRSTKQILLHTKLYITLC